MKKCTKSKAEKENLAFDLLDTIDNSYLSEALELHEAIVDLPKSARSPNLFMKRLSIIAACFLVVLVIIPIVLIVLPTLDKEGQAFEPSLPEQSFPFEDLQDGNLSDVAHIVLSPGEGVDIAIGRLEFVSCLDGIFTFRISALLESAPNISLASAVDGIPYYSLNFGGEYAGESVDNGFAAEITYEDGYTRLLVDASTFIEVSGATPDSLRMVIYIDNCVIGIIPDEK